MKKVFVAPTLLSIIFLLIYPITVFSSSLSTFAEENNKTIIADLGNPTFHNYDRDGELKQNSVMALTFDNKGYLWVATQDGAAYHNGRKWTNVAMPNTLSKDIRAIIVSSDGAILFGTLGGGVHKLQEGKWTTFDKKSSALPNDNVRSLLETTSKDGQHTLWVGTDGGLAKYENEKWAVFNKTNSPLPNNTINVLLESTDSTSQNLLWIATQNGLVKYSQSKWTVFDKTNSPLPNTNITSLLQGIASNGQSYLWIGTQGGLAKYEQDKWTVFDPKSSPILNNTVNALQETVRRDGSLTLWVGTFGGGLAKYVAGKWTVFTSKNSSLPNNNIRTIVKKCSDGLCTLWIGTLGGLVRYEDDKWKSFTAKNSPLPGNDTRAFLEDSSADGQKFFWIGTEGGLVKYQKDSWTVFNTENSPLPSNAVISLLQTTSKDNKRVLWVGTAGGLAKYQEDKWTVFNTSNSPLPTNIILTMIETRSSDGTQTLWLGTARGGLVKYENDKWTTYNTTNSPLPNNYVGAFLVRNKNAHQVLWIATYGGGLVKYEDGKWTVFTSENSTLPNNYVVCFKEIASSNKHSILWIGTSSGLALYDLDLEEWVKISDKNLLVLSNQIVSAIEQNNQKKIYICTFQNVTCLTPLKSKENGSEYQIYTFTADDGSPANGATPLASLLDSNQYLWVGNLQGIGILDTSKTIQDNISKPLLIEKYIVNGKIYSSKKLQNIDIANIGTFAESLNKSILNYDQNNITFEYALLSYLKEKQTSYQTQLEGFDPQPSDWVKDYKRIYTNLNKGDYVFKVLAKDYNGNISTPIVVKFSIKPAIWYTWWAYTLYSILLISIIFSIGYYQINKTKQKAQEFLQRQQEQALLKESQLRAEAAELQAKATEAQARAIEEENKRKSQELAYARQMQLSLLPKQNIFLDELEIFGQMRTATEVGGDYYDFIKIDDHRYLLVIGDATGHGVGAGLVVGMCKVLLINAVNSLSVADPIPSLTDLMQSFNSILKSSLSDRRTGICLCLAILDTNKMIMEVCSSGMPFPFLFKRENLEITSLEMRGQPLGFLKKLAPKSKTIHLEKGDSLIFISDGYDERKNLHNQIWGYQQVKNELSKICKKAQTAESIASNLLISSDLFASNLPNNDDMTIVVIHRKNNQMS